MLAKKTQIINIRSKDRINKLDPPYNYKARLNPFTPKFNRVGLLSASIPTCYDIFNSTNNKFFFMENDGGAGDACVATIPEGTYDTTSFIAALGGAMTAVTVNGNVYSVTYSTLKQKLTITQTGAATGFYVMDGANSANERAGFLNPAASFVTSVVGGQMMWLGPEKSVFLNLREVSGGIITSNPNAGIYNFLVNMDVNGGELNTWLQQSEFVQTEDCAVVALQELTVELRLGDGSFFPLQQEWQFAIEIELV